MTCSVNEPRAHNRSAHRHRRLCHTSANDAVPNGTSCGRVVTLPLTDVENTPHDGHADAASSAVTTCTTRPPNPSSKTSRTANPSRSNNRVAPAFGTGDTTWTCVR